MTTYKKPLGAVDSYMRPSRTYDYGANRGINKKVNCLIAFAAVALVIALAALSLAIVLLFQVPVHSNSPIWLQYIMPSSQQAVQTSEVEVEKISLLAERIRLLEEQISENTSRVKVVLPNSANPPILIDEIPENSVTPEHAYTQEENYLLVPSEAILEETEDTGSTYLPPPQKSTTNVTPEGSKRITEVKMHEIPTDCPDYSRPLCPDGYSIVLNSDDPCPKPVCHPGDDEEDNEGSGYDCPDYPQPKCPAGYVIRLNEEPCPRPVCRSVPED